MNCKLITKLLLVVLSLVFVVTAATSCGVDKDEFEELKNKIDTLGSQIDGNSEGLSASNENIAANSGKIDENTAKIETLETKKVVAELQALVDQIKLTADAAATQKALDSARVVLETADLTNKSELNAAITAANDAITALSATVNTNTESASAALLALQQAVAANEEDIEGKLTTTRTDLATLSEKVTEEIETALSKLQSSHSSLTGRVEVLEALVNDTAKGNEALAAEIASIKLTLSTIGGDIATQIREFAEGFELASKILAGDAKEEDFTEDGDFATYGGLTLVAFDARIKEITDTRDWYYAIDGDTNGDVWKEYEKFDAATKNIRFFLGRATSKESVKAYFDALETAISELKTLPELLDMVLNDTKIVESDGKAYGIIPGLRVTDSEASYKLATDIKNMCDAKGLDITALVDAYNLVVSARKNLADAKTNVGTVDTAIDAIDDTVVYGTSESDIEDARSAFNTFKNTYFGEAKAAEVALYDANVFTAEKLTADYAKLTNAEQRVIELDNAKAAADEASLADMESAIDNYDTARPLWSDFGDIQTRAQAVNAWATAHAETSAGANDGWAELEEVNVRAILGSANIDNLENAYDYSKAMNNLYTTYKVDELKATIEDFNAKGEKQLYSQYNAFYTAYNKLLELKDKVDDVDDWAEEKDTNFSQMINVWTDGSVTTDNYTTFTTTVKTRMDALQQGYEKIQDVMGKINYELIEVSEGVYDVDIYDYDKIDGYLTEYDGIRHWADQAGVELDSGSVNYIAENYNLIVKPGMDAYDLWMKTYKEKTAVIAEIYTAIENATAHGGYKIYEGNEVVAINAKVIALINEYGVGNLDVKVWIDGAPSVVILKNVVDDWNVILGNYKALAEAAVKATTDNVNPEYENIKDLNTNNLNNYSEIMDAYAALKAWADTYLKAGWEANRDAAKTAIEAVQEITNVAQLDAYYAFVDDAKFMAIYDKYVAAQARMDAAEGEWAGIEAQFAALANKWTAGNATAVEAGEWDIHSGTAFGAADSAYKAFIVKYFTDDATGAYDAALNTKDNTFATDCYNAYYDTDKFEDQYDAFKTLKTAVDAEFNAIKVGIAGLGDIDLTDTAGDIDDYITAVDNLRTAIANFKTSYLCDVLACTAAGEDSYAIGDALRLALAKAQTKAAYTKAAKTALEAAELAGNNELVAKINGAYPTANNALNDILFSDTLVADLTRVYDFVISGIVVTP